MNSKIFDVIIVGAGPSSLFLASNLQTKNFLIIEKGNSVEKRKCPMKKECINCTQCSNVYGVGGAGLFSDGKLNFSTEIGGKPLDVMDNQIYNRINENFIEKFNIEFEKTKHSEIDSFNKLHRNISFHELKQFHLGSDNLPDFINSLIDNFRKNIITNSIVADISKDKEIFVIDTNKNTYFTNNVIIATGQSGSEFTLDIANKFNIKIENSNADLGVRVECKNSIYEKLINMQYDPKIYFDVSNGSVRTFCTNPEGFVVTENKGFFVSANGHSMKKLKSENTNFALMHNFHIDEPKKYIDKILKKIQKENNNKIILQNTKDFINNKKTIELDNLSPTCTNYQLNEINKYYPIETNNALVDSINLIEEIVPGFIENSVLYGPEVKLYNYKIDIKVNTFESNVDGLYFIGDCCGHIHGLLNAIYSGISCSIFLNQKIGVKNG